MGAEGKVIPNNTHFDTTRANIENSGAVALGLPVPEGSEPSIEGGFKGNMDLTGLQAIIQKEGTQKIPLCMLIVTNNSAGGQPVSLEHIRNTAEICRQNGILFFLDACRFTENAYFIKLRGKGYRITSEHKSEECE